MMGIGHGTDLVAGQLSRILHGLRGPKHNTVRDLEPYLDRPLSELCPEPPPLEDVRLHESLVSRALHTTTLSWRSTHRVRSPSYRVRYDRDYRAVHTAWARWLRPEGTQRRNCLIYIHGWLEPGSWVEEALIFPGWTRELEVDVVHIALPFHGRRNPRSALFSGEFFWTADLVRSFEGALQAVHDTRSLMGWLRRRGYEQVGVTGVSLGGSLAMLIGCLAPMPDYLIPIVAHLQLAEAVENASILWRMKHDLEHWGVHEPERRRIFERLGLDGAKPLMAPGDQLWIEARDDAHIDPELVRAQWESWGRPGIHWLRGGHMTFPLFLPEITRVMGEFLEKRG